MRKKVFYNVIVCLISLSSITGVAFASSQPGVGIVASSENKLKESKSINKNEAIDNDSYKKQQEQLTKEKAAFWGLTVEEWQKFEALNEKGGRGYWSPNLDPLTTLGVESNTPEEREHYAKLLAKKEFERTEKELEFQRTYDKEFKKMYPDILPVELDDNPNFVAPLNMQGERITLFLDINDAVRGITLLNKALKTGKEMDIYLLNTTGDDNKIQQWASLNSIPIDRVKSSNITLNHDKGQWDRIGKKILPIALQNQSGNKYRQLELGD